MSVDDIIVSGIAGRFPECDNVEELWKALYDGTDLLTIDDRRYPPGTYKCVIVLKSYTVSFI